MEHSEKVLGVAFISHDQTSEVLQIFQRRWYRFSRRLIVGRVLSIPAMSSMP
jgi:hypothetical protein